MNIEQGIGEPLSISTLLDLPNAIITGEINARTIPKSAYCTDCVEGMYHFTHLFGGLINLF
jgi:hypothetical protein